MCSKTIGSLPDNSQPRRKEPKAHFISWNNLFGLNLFLRDIQWKNPEAAKEYQRLLGNEKKGPFIAALKRWYQSCFKGQSCTVMINILTKLVL